MIRICVKIVRGGEASMPREIEIAGIVKWRILIAI